MSTEVEEIHTYSFAHACIHGDVRSTVMTRVGSAFLGQALHVGHIGHFRACEPCERYLHISIANGVLCNGICSSEGMMHGSALSPTDESWWSHDC